MTSNFQKDWRDLDDSLALDVTLIESVFYQLCKRKRNQRLDLKSFEDEEMTQFEKKMFSKADVLSALEKTDGYLEKRPWLRVLHTQLACISISRDGLTLQDFLCSRQRDRTVCLSDIRRQLETIYANAKRSKEIEDKHKASVNHARAVSPWCVYNFKWLHSSPAKQLYNVHPIPQAKTKLQLTAEVVGSQARAIVNAIVGLALDKLVAFYLTQGLPNEIQTDRRLAVGILSLKPSRQRDVKLNCERETKLQALRLELFAPTAKFLVGNKGSE
ncbi:hypothetical protein Plhal304r1_c012g0048251 [Plasmopara halstedii]